MKARAQNRIKQIKEMVTHSHPVNEVPDRIPTYRGSGKPVEYVRHLPPIRDPKQIDLHMLAEVIRELAPENRVSVFFNSIELNGNEVKLDFSKGMGTAGALKFRYTDLRDLLEILEFEGVLHCPHKIAVKMSQIYRERCLKH
jgi:hypothetical protein